MKYQLTYVLCTTHTHKGQSLTIQASQENKPKQIQENKAFFRFTVQTNNTNTKRTLNLSIMMSLKSKHILHFVSIHAHTQNGNKLPLQFIHKEVNKEKHRKIWIIQFYWCKKTHFKNDVCTSSGREQLCSLRTRSLSPLRLRGKDHLCEVQI